MRLMVLAVLGVMVTAGFSGCGPSPDQGDAAGAAAMVDGGSWYVRERWPQDGDPIESESFVVYSDAASVEARREVAEVAEQVWAELLDDFSIEPGMLRYPDGQDKIDVYAYRNHDPQDWAARAYYGGLIMWSPDHEARVEKSFAPVMKHELVHVLQWLISGNPDPHPVDVWFLEGLPEAMSGGTTGGAVRGLDELDDLTGEFGTISPISFKTYSQIATPDAGEHFNYPMFQLAVEYLLDDDGYGRSPEDARDVFIDVAEGASFEAAFEDRMEVSLAAYEREFFDRMDGYLPEYRNPVFSPPGFALLSAIVILFVIGVPAVGYRRWRADATTGTMDAAAPGRAARIGFHSEMAVASAIIIVFFLGLMFRVGTLNELNNAMFATGRTRAHWILVAYLFTSVGLVVLAVHRWVNRSRLAFLVTPLVIVATVGTLVITISAIL